MAYIRFCPQIFLCLAVVGGLAGCATPARRAREHAVLFGRLSPTDQQLVLHGHVRKGLGQVAVLIAWGKPNEKYGAASPESTKEPASREIWVYRRQITTFAPIGSYDQWTPGRGFVARGASLPFSAGFGFGGSGYEGLLLYHTRLQYTESFVRRVVFVNGRLESYEQHQGESPPLP